MRNDDLSFWKAVYLGVLATSRVVGLDNPHGHCEDVANQATKALRKQRVDAFPDPEPRSITITTRDLVPPGDTVKAYWICDGLFRVTAIEASDGLTEVEEVDCGNVRIFVAGDTLVRKATANVQIQFTASLTNHHTAKEPRRLSAVLTGLFVSQVATDDYA